MTLAAPGRRRSTLFPKGTSRNDMDGRRCHPRGQRIRGCTRAGKGQRYREVPIHSELRNNLAVWITDERPQWPGADNPALLLNRRGQRLSTRGASDILTAIGEHAGPSDEFTSHVLRHTFGTTLIRSRHDVVLVDGPPPTPR